MNQKNLSRWMAVSLAFLGCGFAAQTMAEQTGQVAVDISAIRPAIAKEGNLDVSTIPASVQTSVEVAALVCDVSATALAPDPSRDQQACKAVNTSPALNELVLKQVGASK